MANSFSHRAHRFGTVSAGVGVILLTLLAAAAAQEPVLKDEKAGLGLRVEFMSQARQRTDVFQPGELLTLSLDLTDAASSAPALGLTLEGWLRPVEPTNLKCLEAGRAFRATRRLPTGAVDLNGVVFFAFHDDGSFAVIDPRLDLASANMLAAGTLGGKPAKVTVGADSQSVLIVDQQRTSVRRIRIDGRVETVQSGLEGFLALHPLNKTGYVILSQAGKRLERRNNNGITQATFSTDNALAGLAPQVGNSIVAWSKQEVMLLDARSLRLRHKVMLPVPLRDVVAWQDKHGGPLGYAALTETGDELYSGYEDQRSDPAKTPLVVKAERLALDFTQNKLLAWNRQGGLALVDIARGEFAGAVSVYKGISAIAFTRKAAFFLAEDASSVAVLELATARAGFTPQLREVRMGPRGDQIQQSDGLLLSLAPSPQALAVHPASNTGFVIDERSAIGDAPPMSAVALRGGRIYALQVIDRSIRETSPGHFETRFIVPKPGAYDLVITTGIGGLTQCLPFEVQGTTPAKAGVTRSFRLLLDSTQLQSGVSNTISIRVVDKDGKPIRLSDPRIGISSLEFGWRPDIDPQLTASGDIRFDVSLPFPGLYGLTVHDKSWGSAPAVNEVLEALP